MNNETCCPQFDPAPWDEKTFEWKNKKFVKDKVLAVINMPLNFGAVMKRPAEKVRKSEATIPDYLCLSDHISKWNKAKI